MALAPKILVRGGTVLDDRGERRADVLIEDGSITAVGPDLEVPRAARTLDAGGCFVLPGLVDMQVHVREPGREEAETIESGSRAAALGGFTAMVAMPNTNPCLDEPEIVRWVRDRGRAIGLCDVLPSAAITVGRCGSELVDMGDLYDAGVRLFTDDGDAVMDSQLMLEAFRTVRNLPGAYLGQHAEHAGMVAGGHLHDGAVTRALGLHGRPAEAEELVIARDLALALTTGGRYHVLHLSTAGGAALVRGAKRAGIAVTAEVTPQHLIFTDDVLSGGDALFKMNPPLRSHDHRTSLRDAFVAGVIDAIATDHAPHPAEAKAMPIDLAPPGMTGLETALASVHTHLVLTGLADLTCVIGSLSWRPSAISGLSRLGHGGPIRPGSPANIAVFDPTQRWTVDPKRLGSLSHNNPFRGGELQGRIRTTLLRGHPTLLDGELQA